jgi:4a-hydroxytetrahydrobiopterin dehydratase
MRLTEEEVAKGLTLVPLWALDGKKIHRRYKFADFKGAIAFVNKVADTAERMNHHPFISIDYKFVTLELTSWHAGGLTEADFEEAKNFDAIYDTGTTV